MRAMSKIAAIAIAAVSFVAVGTANASGTFIGVPECFERPTAWKACQVTDDTVPSKFLKHVYAAKRSSGAWFKVGENEEFITYSHNELDGTVNGNKHPTNFYIWGAKGNGEQITIRDVVELRDCLEVIEQPE